MKFLEFQFLSASAQEKNEKHVTISAKELKKLGGEWHVYWLKELYSWFIDNGIDSKNLRLREHLKDELAHYSSANFAIASLASWLLMPSNSPLLIIVPWSTKARDIFSKLNSKSFGLITIFNGSLYFLANSKSL